jgi:uncharacterized protein
VLHSFRIANHKSIHRDQEIDLNPVLPDSEFDPLTIAAFYGANASGKSNLLDAFAWVVHLARGDAPLQAADQSLRTPFKLTADGFTKPSVAEMVFSVDGVRYVYGLAVDDASFIEEWLYSYPIRQRRILFERGRDDVKVGPTIEGRREVAALAKRTRKDRSVLAILGEAEVPEWAPAIRWFSDIDWMRSNRAPRLAARLLEREINRHPVLIELAKCADLGIRDIEFVERVVEPSEEHMEYAASLEQRLIALETLRDSSETTRWIDTELMNLRNEIYTVRRPRVNREPLFYHGDSRVPLRLSEQSAGTIEFMTTAAQITRTLRQGGILLADEIETSIHPRLLVRVLELFRSPEVNRTGAQLLFTTHDSSLLGTSLGEPILRRDEVWFVEKDSEGATSIVPLSDYKPRKGENQERRYLGGAYGAVPDVDTGSLIEVLLEHGGDNL